MNKKNLNLKRFDYNDIINNQKNIKNDYNNFEIFLKNKKILDILKFPIICIILTIYFNIILKIIIQLV